MRGLVIGTMVKINKYLDNPNQDLDKKMDELYKIIETNPNDNTIQND